MSLHNQSYLVSSHQADMRRHATEHRLAAKERTIRVEPTTDHAPAPLPAPTAIHRLVLSIGAALRPVRRVSTTPRA
jgi:hypothetical protein